MEIDWNTYKNLTRQEVLPGDENFDHIITTYDEEFVYTAPVKPKEKNKTNHEIK